MNNDKLTSNNGTSGAQGGFKPERLSKPPVKPSKPEKK